MATPRPCSRQCATMMSSAVLPERQIGGIVVKVNEGISHEYMRIIFIRSVAAAALYGGKKCMPSLRDRLYRAAAARLLAGRTMGMGDFNPNSILETKRGCDMR